MPYGSEIPWVGNRHETWAEAITAGAVLAFRGPHRYMSNFYHAPFYYNGVRYNSVEVPYQVAKCLRPDDCRRLQEMTSAAAAKREGQKVRMRTNWETVDPNTGLAFKVAVMHHIVAAKFAQNWRLAENLVMTYPAELYEGNHHGDDYWGVIQGSGAHLVGLLGTNWLGRILMAVRERLIQAEGEA